jgi:glycosyltransferase involved in cell wall biosynthesis
MTSDLVSIIMPAYNCQQFVGDAIQCILNQTYTNWELLIADDGSKDKTKELIDNYYDSRIKTFHNAENQGYLKTWNKLIQKAQGKYVTFLDADDTCSFERIEKMIRFLNENPAIGVVGSNFNRINDIGDITYSSDFALEHKEIVKKMPHEFNVVGSAVMLRREILDVIGGYNEFFNRIGAEDYYWLYLISEKYRIQNLPDHLYNYRFNQNSVMGNLTLNPEKLFISEVLIKVIEQRKKTGADDIEQGNWETLYKILSEKLKEVGSSTHSLYHYVAKRRFYEGHRKLAISLMKSAIKSSPFSYYLYWDLIYFWRNKS